MNRIEMYKDKLVNVCMASHNDSFFLFCFVFLLFFFFFFWGGGGGGLLLFLLFLLLFYTLSELNIVVFWA